MFRLFFILLMFASFPVFGQDSNTPVPFTLGDRDRLMRNEQKIDALRNEMNVRFESIDARFESMQKQMDIKFESQQKQINIIITLLFFLLGAMLSLMGFVIYDRRTAIKPLQKRQDTIEDVLFRYAKGDKKLLEILKNAGIF